MQNTGPSEREAALPDDNGLEVPSHWESYEVRSKDPRAAATPAPTLHYQYLSPRELDPPRVAGAVRRLLWAGSRMSTERFCSPRHNGACGKRSRSQPAPSCGANLPCSPSSKQPRQPRPQLFRNKLNLVMISSTSEYSSPFFKKAAQGTKAQSYGRQHCRQQTPVPSNWLQKAEY